MPSLDYPTHFTDVSPAALLLDSILDECLLGMKSSQTSPGTGWGWWNCSFSLLLVSASKPPRDKEKDAYSVGSRDPSSSPMEKTHMPTHPQQL